MVSSRTERMLDAFVTLNVGHQEQLLWLAREFEVWELRYEYKDPSSS